MKWRRIPGWQDRILLKRGGRKRTSWQASVTMHGVGLPCRKSTSTDSARTRHSDNVCTCACMHVTRQWLTSYLLSLQNAPLYSSSSCVSYGWVTYKPSWTICNNGTLPSWILSMIDLDKTLQKFSYQGRLVKNAKDGKTDFRQAVPRELCNSLVKGDWVLKPKCDF